VVLLLHGSIQLVSQGIVVNELVLFKMLHFLTFEKGVRLYIYWLHLSIEAIGFFSNDPTLLIYLGVVPATIKLRFTQKASAEKMFTVPAVNKREYCWPLLTFIVPYFSFFSKTDV
jgi:hypothetical protein